MGPTNTVPKDTLIETLNRDTRALAVTLGYRDAIMQNETGGKFDPRLMEIFSTLIAKSPL